MVASVDTESTSEHLFVKDEMRLTSGVLLFLLAIAWSSLSSLEAQNGTTSGQPGLNVRVQAFPETIFEGQTEASEIRCDYRGPSPVVSMSILKEDPDSSDPVPLAHVDLNRPKHVVGKNGILAKQTSGEIKADDQSGYLSIKWSHPGQHQEGLYKCQVMALVAYTRVATMEKSVKVTVQKITKTGLLRLVTALKKELGSVKGKVGSVVEEVGSVKEEVGSVKEEVGSVKEEVGSVKDEVGSVKDEVGSVKDEVGSVKEDIGPMKDDIGSLKSEGQSVKGEVATLSLTSGWTTYKRHSYYLQRNVAMTNIKAQAFCQRLGGYLAEIDDREEYHFALGFVTPQISKNTLVLIGGSDAGHEGTWVFPRTKTLVSFFDWYPPGEPSDRGRGRENCLYIYDGNRKRFRMFDGNCDLAFFRTRHYPVGILCEVPSVKG